MNSHVVYTGEIVNRLPVVRRDGQLFQPPRLRYHDIVSSRRWAWGGPCDGAYRLAYALLLDCTDSFLLATAFHVPFALEVLTRFPHEYGWKLDREAILAWVKVVREGCQENLGCMVEMIEDAREFHRVEGGGEEAR